MDDDKNLFFMVYLSFSKFKKKEDNLMKKIKGGVKDDCKVVFDVEYKVKLKEVEVEIVENDLDYRKM